MMQFNFAFLVDLTVHRGGCIICVDYHDYNMDYGYLMINFRNTARVITNKLNALSAAGFRGELAYFFGFSFGARLITTAANDIGEKKFARADCKKTKQS